MSEEISKISKMIQYPGESSDIKTESIKYSSLRDYAKLKFKIDTAPYDIIFSNLLPSEFF